MLAAAATLLKAFWGVCTLRLAPQDIPRSSALLFSAGATNLAISTSINNIQLALSSAFSVAVLEMTVLAGLTAALLFSFGRFPRFTQTLTALLGSGAVIGLVVLAHLLALPQIPQILRITIFVWNLLVMAHILRHALEFHIVASFFLAVGYAFILIQVIWFFDRLLNATA
jgi:hypothetical protein